MTPFEEQALDELLKEQHNNTRHDSIEEMLKTQEKYNTYTFPPAAYDMVNQMMGAIMNLKQRQPRK